MFQNLLTWGYWFALKPESLSPIGFYIFWGLLAVLFLLTIISAIIKKRGGLYRGLLNRLYSFALANFIIGLIIIGLNYEAVPFLSARFWIGLWIIGLLVWLVFILKGLKKIPAQKREREAEKERQKYLP